MFNHVPCCMQCSGNGSEVFQHLLSQSFLALENVSRSYDQILRKATATATFGPDFEVETSSLSHDIKQVLEHLLVMADVIFSENCCRQGAAIIPSPLDWPENNTLSTSPRRRTTQDYLPDQLLASLRSNDKTSLVDYLSRNLKKSVLNVSHVQVPEVSIIELQKGATTTTTIQLDEIVLAEEVSPRMPPSEPSGEVVSYHNLKFLRSASNFLKHLRMKIQSRFLDGIPTFFIVDLEDFERQFQIKRDQTTDSIWNADHLENRLEVFEESEGGISYRLKCICQEDSAHNLDPYCPRNIPSEPKEESSGSDSESETEEDGRVRREKEKKKKMRQNREEAIKAIMELVGLSNVKEHVEKLLVKAKTMARQGIDIKDERYGTVLIGNSGTGKTTFAKQYAKLLHSMGVIGSEQVKHTTGIYLADGGISRIKGYIEDLVESNGGVLFIDDAHYLLNDEHNGIRVLDYLLGEVDSRRGKAVFIFAGKEKEMMDVLGHGDKNLSSLLPYHIRFKDYTDEELREILWYSMKKKFDGKAEVEGGKEGLYMRIATRRLGRTRGSTLFANARSVNNLLSQILDRQAARLSNTRAERITAAAQDAKLPDSPSNSEGKESVNEVQDAKSSEDKDVVAGNIPAESHRENTWGFVGTRTTEELTPTKLEEQIPATEVSNSLSATAEEETKSDDNLDSKTEAENKNDDDTLSEVDSAEEEDYKFTKEDIIGPNPSAAVLESPAWQKMQRLTGLESVKDSILGLLELVKTNYDRELEEKVPLKVSLNRLFLGPPGTGKTLVAKLYGQLLAEIGILSKGDVIMKNPSDLIGRYIGDSENNTRAALRSAMGNVLVIDEAYMMYSGGDTGNESDSFRQGIMDTLVGEIQSEPGEDRCVLLLGYDDAMSEMLQNSNPGLNRRFPMSDAFWFQNFTLPELECILKSKLEDHVLEATEPAIKVAMDVLEKASSRVNFGNGGEVENLITKAKINYQKRVSSMPVPDRPKTWIFAPQDFDPEFDRGKSATNNLKELFKDVIGCEDIISKLEQYQRISQVMKLKGLDPKDFIPTNFVFKGPPGTGKTTTARKIAQVYYDMGHLADPSVIECSASDLVGKYVGQSAPKTAKVFERALGRVLFIDEAYRLISSPDSCSFNSEVVSELVDLLTKPKYHGKLIVILAGYTAEMNTLLSTNPGLASRFPEEIHFPSLGPDHCLEILKRNLGKNGVSCPVLGRPSLSVCKNLMRKMRFLGETKGWGNARDVETLGKNLIREAFGKVKDVEDDLICTAEMVGNAMDNMLKERRARGVVLQREREERVVDVGCEDY